MRGRWRGVVAAGLGALSLVACSTIFDGELGEVVACEQEGVFGSPACPEGQTCVAGACADVGLPAGATCEADDACRAPAACLSPVDVGSTGAARCSLGPCCASSDCGPAADGQICWLPPNGGGGLCWDAEALGRPALGGGRSGDACGGGGDCRSGICDGGECIDGCCLGSYCPADELCRVKTTPLSDDEVWTCGKPPTGLPPPETCNSADDCPSGKCVQVADDIGICARACCGSADCEALIVMGAKRPVACTLVEGLRSCGALLTDTAIKDVGAACSADAECRSGWCIEEGGAAYCTDLCCDDPSCGDASAFACLPRPLGDAWALRCVRK